MTKEEMITEEILFELKEQKKEARMTMRLILQFMACEI